MSGEATIYDSIGFSIKAISDMINGSYIDNLDSEAVNWRRLTKVSMEANEVLEAYAGYIGENPRKGYTHSRQDVLNELLDTAIAALAAYHHMAENWIDTDNVLVPLVEHAEFVAERLAKAIAEGTS